MKNLLLIGSLAMTSFVGAQTISKSDTAIEGQLIETNYELGRGGGIALTQSNSTDIGDASVACVNAADPDNGIPQTHTDNSYYRLFDLTGFGMTTVQNIDIGVQTATNGGAGSQPIEVKIHSITRGVPFVLANMVEVASMPVSVDDAATGTVMNVVINGVVSGNQDDLVVEVFSPDGINDNHSFFIGSNDLGQTAPSFIKADTCGLTEVGDLADINFADMHIVMVVNGTATMPVELMKFSID